MVAEGEVYEFDGTGKLAVVVNAPDQFGGKTRDKQRVEIEYIEDGTWHREHGDNFRKNFDFVAESREELPESAK